MRNLFFALVTLLSLSSCFNTKILHGNISKNEPMVKINKEWNHHIIFGLVPIDAKMDAKEYIGDRENYMVKTNQTFLNLLVHGLTFGIYTPTTTSYYIPLDDMPKKK